MAAGRESVFGVGRVDARGVTLGTSNRANHGAAVSRASVTVLRHCRCYRQIFCEDLAVRRKQSASGLHFARRI